LKYKRLSYLAVALLAVCGAYANSFHNGFHFDDFHTVVDNPYIREWRNIPRFFTDATTFSVLPANRTYRPFVSMSLAMDYALGHGYNVVWFHISTFLIFLLQLAVMQAIFRRILNAVAPGPRNDLIATVGVAWYGLHPAIAETVNYFIQRGDIFSTFGVVAALAMYVELPQLRKTGLYLLPFAFGLLSKPPALVFPVLLFAYLTMFEPEQENRFRRALLASVPSFVVCVLLMVLQAAMTPKTYTPSIISAYSYLITQPYVLLRYFSSFFLPIHLNVDTDLSAFDTLTPVAMSGFVFLLLLAFAAWITARRRQWRPISFGLLWFVIASVPTSVYRLSEVENDHRMYFPLVGLTLAVVWGGWLLVEGFAAKAEPRLRWVSAGMLVLLLSAYGYGTMRRNEVWRTDETLWRDDVLKSPRNGRGLMIYGLTQMEKGAYPTALDYFTRALVLTPNYPTLEINLGVVNGAMGRGDEAQRHFLRAIELAPKNDEAHFYYGRWLSSIQRSGEALEQLKLAVELNPARLAARDLLATTYMSMGDVEHAHDVAAATLQLAPADTEASALLSQSVGPTADFWINASLARYQQKDYQGCIAAAREALKLRPDSAIAYNNIGAAYAGLGQWEMEIESEREALRLQPDFQLAKNNLAWALSQKKLQGH
jgi:protein O-mannosyl-transferase